MLNLNRQEDLLTQGQSPAKRVLANPGLQNSVQREQAGAPETGPTQNPASGASPAAGAPNAMEVANRVYELMRKEMLYLDERKRYLSQLIRD
jgi:hypothetical protein